MQSMNAPFPYSAVRDKILRVVGKELIGKLVVYASDQTHSTLQKAFQENKGAKFSKYELISSAIAGLTLQSLYLRWFKLSVLLALHLSARSSSKPELLCPQIERTVDILTNFDLSVDGLLLQGWNYEYGDFAALQRSRVADTTIAKQSPPSSPVLPPPSAQPSTTAVGPAFTHRRQPSLRPTVSHSGEVAIDEDDRHLTCETPLRYFSGDVRGESPTIATVVRHRRQLLLRRRGRRTEKGPSCATAVFAAVFCLTREETREGRGKVAAHLHGTFTTATCFRQVKGREGSTFAVVACSPETEVKGPSRCLSEMMEIRETLPPPSSSTLAAATGRRSEEKGRRLRTGGASAAAAQFRQSRYSSPGWMNVMDKKQRKAEEVKLAVDHLRQPSLPGESPTIATVVRHRRQLLLRRRGRRTEKGPSCATAVFAAVFCLTREETREGRGKVAAHLHGTFTTATCFRQVKGREGSTFAVVACSPETEVKGPSRCLSEMMEIRETLPPPSSSTLAAATGRRSEEKGRRLRTGGASAAAAQFRQSRYSSPGWMNVMDKKQRKAEEVKLAVDHLRQPSLP
nr:tyrosine decarboxylase 1 [Ipomoea trifida]